MRAAKTILAVIVVLALLAGAAFFLRPIAFFNAAMILHEGFTGVENRQVEIGGYRVHYLAEGPKDGPVLVLVHGLGGRAEDWRNLAPNLVRAGFRLYIPDLLGYGRSEKPANFSYSVHDQAALVVNFMDALGLHQVDLGGWSMGGWIVELIAAQHPERVQRLVLFDAAGLDIKPNWNTALFTPADSAELNQLDALLMPHPPRVPAFIARDVVRISRRDGWVIQRAVAQMLTAHDVTDSLLPQLKMPVLIVWGADDSIMPVDQAKSIHRLIPQSRLAIIPGCGHLAPLQCSSQIAPPLLAFLRP